MPRGLFVYFKPKSQQHVQKIPSGFEIDIFDEENFADRVQQARFGGNFTELYQLKEHCTVHISFFKGWGERYKRKTLAEVPVWLELKLVRPLKFLDKVLRQSQMPKTDQIEDELL